LSVLNVLVSSSQRTQHGQNTVCQYVPDKENSKVTVQGIIPQVRARNSSPFDHLTGQTSPPPKKTTTTKKKKKQQKKSNLSSLVADKLVLVLSSPSWWVQPCIDWRFKHGEYMLWSSRWRLYKQSSRSSCRPIVLLCLPTILKQYVGKFIYQHIWLRSINGCRAAENMLDSIEISSNLTKCSCLLLMDTNFPLPESSATFFTCT